MNILHYSLGIQPYRSGGLAIYTKDLLSAQKKRGHTVTLLYPGSINWRYPKTQIKADNPINGINVYELKNPLPVPLLHGIKTPVDFSNSKNIDTADFIYFLDTVSPDIIHIHTLMGLPLEFIDTAKQKNIKLVFTTHDYFGLCPKVNFIDSQGRFCENPCGLRCHSCNIKSPSTLFLRLRNFKCLIKVKKWIQKCMTSC